VSGKVQANETAIGNLPRPQDLNTRGLDISSTDLQALLSVEPTLWKKEVAEIREYLNSYGKRLPAELSKQLDAVAAKLN
jgi:phosphoenolpyruvate carboxykinase (GTP)